MAFLLFGRLYLSGSSPLPSKSNGSLNSLRAWARSLSRRAVVADHALAALVGAEQVVAVWGRVYQIGARRISCPRRGSRGRSVTLFEVSPIFLSRMVRRKAFCDRGLRFGGKLHKLSGISRSRRIAKVCRSCCRYQLCRLRKPGSGPQRGPDARNWPAMEGRGRTHARWREEALVAVGRGRAGISNRGPSTSRSLSREAAGPEQKGHWYALLLPSLKEGRV